MLNRLGNWELGGDDDIDLFKQSPRWWFQTFFIFTPTWGTFPFWLIFFKWVESTNESLCFLTIRSWRDFPSMMVQLGVQHLGRQVKRENPRSYTSEIQLNSLPLKIDDWKILFPFWLPIFKGLCEIFGVLYNLVFSGVFVCFFWLAQEVRWGSKWCFWSGALLLMEKPDFGWKDLENMVVPQFS